MEVQFVTFMQAGFSLPAERDRQGAAGKTQKRTVKPAEPGPPRAW